jgi:hypothetical protein
MTDDDALRNAIAEAYGLPEQAVKFLEGTTVEEVEQSAVALADLLATSADVSPMGDIEVDPITASLQSKQQRQAARTAAILGPSAQPRDSEGRYTERVADFHGGARQSVPAVPDPVREHGKLVSALAQLRQLGGSGF